MHKVKCFALLRVHSCVCYESFLEHGKNDIQQLTNHLAASSWHIANSRGRTGMYLHFVAMNSTGNLVSLQCPRNEGKTTVDINLSPVSMICVWEVCKIFLCQLTSLSSHHFVAWLLESNPISSVRSRRSFLTPTF